MALIIIVAEIQHKFRLENKYYKPNNGLIQSTLAGYYFYLLLGCVIVMDYLKLVEELNSELYDKHGETEGQFFFTASGFIDILGFENITLWHSEDDDRKWIEKKNDYEPMKPYLKKKLKTYGKKLTVLAS